MKIDLTISLVRYIIDHAILFYGNNPVNRKLESSKLRLDALKK